METEANEEAPVAVKKGPDQPSGSTIAEHEATGHACYRGWCKWCVDARAMENLHFVRPASAESEVPCIACDYAFLGEEDKETMPILVAKDGRSKAIWAMSLQAKGVVLHAVHVLMSVIKDTG